MKKKENKDPPIPRAYWRLGYNPPPTFPPPDWILDLNEDLAREWRSPATTTDTSDSK